MSDLIYIVTEEDELQCTPVYTHIRRHFNLSSRLRGKIKREKLVLLNGEPVESYIVPMAGDEIKIKMPEEVSYFPPEDVPFDVLLEDDDILAINKPAGYVVHPTYGFEDATIANGISKYMYDNGRPFKIRFINRLDMDTSGVLLVAKNAYTQNDYTMQQKLGEVRKEYVAVVFGKVAEDEGIIDAPIGKPDPEKPFRGVVPDGKPSQTEYKVLERFEGNEYCKDGYSLVRLRLLTGRTHQIRVHMKHIGHTLVGDEFYGGQCDELIKRQALHAAYLSFKHPHSKELLKLEAPLPEDMETLINKLRDSSKLL